MKHVDYITGTAILNLLKTMFIVKITLTKKFENRFKFFNTDFITLSD